MSDSIEARAGALLLSLIRQRGTTVAAVAAALGLAGGEVASLVEGTERLDLARLEQVLGHLGTSPAEFFARLYAQPAPAEKDAAASAPAPAGPGPDDPIPRQEVEALLRELRGMIDGMVRVLDAERLLDRDGGG